MNTLDNNFSVSHIYRNIFTLFKRHPILFVPFVMSIASDGLLLVLILMSPRYPSSFAVGTAIKSFWGEEFLHYPANLFLVPKLFTYAHYLFSLLFGILFTGMALALIRKAYVYDNPDFRASVLKSLRRYRRLFTIWVMTAIVMILVMKIPSVVPSLNEYPLIVYVLKFLSTVGVQMVFLCAMPAIIIENKKIPASLERALSMINHYPATLFALILIPSLLFIPLTFINIKLPFLIDHFMPEIVVSVVIVRIIVTNLIDLLVTSSAAMILLMHREIREGAVQ